MIRTASDAPPVLVEGLSKSFGQGKTAVRALDDVSLDVAAGEHLGIIGPSGSGKSTLLHLIAGLTSPETGRVRIVGQDLADMNDRRLTLFRRQHMGMVFQAYNLIPTLTVEDNLKLPLLLGKNDHVDPLRIDHLLIMLGLADRRHHRPDQLSGGEQQRVAIGRAMIAEPSVILADEPTGNLDSVSGQKLCALMSQLCKDQGRTIVTVTHDPAVAIWADRVGVLKDGRLIDTLDTSTFATSRELGVRFLEVLANEAELDDEAEAAVCV